MSVRNLLYLLPLVFLTLTGCATQSATSASRTSCDLACDDAARLRCVANRLKITPAVRCQVLDVDEPGAFAWRDRKIGITRGLIRICSDDEIAAAIAHEVGHLVHDGHLPAPAALRGDVRDPHADQEASADAMGVKILRASGLNPDAMPTLLAKLKTHIPNRQLGRALDRRIELLHCR